MNPLSKKVNPEMVEMAREARGLTQTALADRLDCTQATVSKIEKGALPVSPEMLKRLSETLDYPEDFFCQKGGIYTPGIKYRRSRSRLRARDRDRLDAKHNIRARVISELLESIEIEGGNIPSMPVEEYDSPAEVAQELREYWGISPSPVGNLTRLIERNGGIIVHTDFQTGEMDGVYYPFPDIPPTIFLDKNQPGDRLRFTLAHELGHIVMHQHPTDPEKVEDQTNVFAGEFMMPEEDIRPQLQRLDLRKLAQLKPKWGISMAALLVRADEIGAISHRKYRSLWAKMGKAGYRKREPAELDVPKEEPKLESRLVEAHLNELGYSVEELAESVHLNIDDFRDQVYDDRGGDNSESKKLHLNGHH